LVGLGPTAATSLDSLVERFSVVGVLRESEHEFAELDPVIARARNLGITIISNATVAAVERAVKELAPDCVVVSSFHRIMPAELLARCRFVNVHYALLPRYRGRANVNWAVINGEKAVGISIHTMASGLDAGNILFQAAVPIGDDDTVADIYERLNEIQAESLADAVQRLLDGDEGCLQDEREATYGCTRVPEDGEIDWSASSTNVHNLVRALARPFPGAFTFYQGARLTVWRAKELAAPPRYEGRIPGRVVQVCRDGGFVDVLTGDGIIRLMEVERECGGSMAAASVIRSVKTTLGLRNAELLERIEQLEQQLKQLAAESPGVA
jgi:methionyl-tRNA formyltransferase